MAHRRRQQRLARARVLDGCVPSDGRPVDDLVSPDCLSDFVAELVE